MTIRETIEKLVKIPGIAGHEDAIIRVMADRLREYTPHVEIDAIGNVIARFGAGEGRALAMLAHMDTIGLMVNRIISDDTVGVVTVGGVNLKALPGTRVIVGDAPGVVGVLSQHQAGSAESIPPADQMYIHMGDTGQVEITTPVLYDAQPVPMGDLLASAYLDNRAGCAVLLAIAAQLADVKLAQPVYLIGTVQEETTCAGAYHALQTVNPAAAIFVDGTVTYDTPETKERGGVFLGGGGVLTSFLYVSGLNGWHAHPGLRAHLKQVAVDGNIRYQQDAVHGLMSDARVVTWLAIPSAVVGIPMRGKHSAQEMIHLQDVYASVKLLLAVAGVPLPDLRRGGLTSPPAPLQTARGD